jgi:hypothetical protein
MWITALGLFCSTSYVLWFGAGSALPPVASAGLGNGASQALWAGTPGAAPPVREPPRGRAAHPIWMLPVKVKGRVKGAAPRAQPSLRGRSKGAGGPLRSGGRAVPRRDDGARLRVPADRGRVAGRPPAAVYSSQPTRSAGSPFAPGSAVTQPNAPRSVELLAGRSKIRADDAANTRPRTG